MNVSARTLCCLVVAACLLISQACANPIPGSPPPGFGGTPPGLFYPVAVAVDPTGTNLYVANSNFDRAYTSGTLVQIKTSLFDGPNGTTASLTAGNVMSQALVDSFAGTMQMNNAGTRLYVTTRDHATLSTAAVDPATGHLLCDQALGCSFNAISLAQPPNYMTDPFALRLAQLPLPGSSIPSNVIVVTHLSPAPSGTNGVGRDANVAVIPEPLDDPPPPAAPLVPTSSNPFSSVSFLVDIGALGASALDVGPSNLVYVGGCFVRVAGESVVPCLVDSGIPQYLQNPLRFFFGTANSNAEVQTSTLGTLFNGGQTEDIAVSTDGTELYVATTTPNALLTVDLPKPGGSPVPTLRSTVVLANIPNRILKLPRPAPAGDLLVITAADPNVVLANTSALLVVDPQAGEVVAQIEPIGKTPYGMTRLANPIGSTIAPTTANAVVTTSYRVFVTLFGDCAVTEVDVPLDAPAMTARVSTVGACP